jgi:hypothetical protein
MKKIIVILLVMAMVFSLCACGADDITEEEKCIGYAIIPHADGEEHVDITKCVGSHGTIVVTTVDGRRIVSTSLIVVLEE